MITLFKDKMIRAGQVINKLFKNKKKKKNAVNNNTKL